MRATALLFITLGALAAASTASAAGTQFQLTPRAGWGNVDPHLPGDNRKPKLLNVGLSAGVLTPAGIVLEAGAERLGYWLFFGDDQFEQYFVRAGYQFNLGHRWLLVPKVGWGYWELDHDGLFVRNRDERHFSGHDAFFEVGVARQVSRVVTLGVAYQRGNYDFGRAYSTNFTVTLNFGGR